MVDPPAPPLFIQRLPWHIGLPFFAFVLAGSVILVGWMGWNLSRESRVQFETLARTNARFLSRMNLPASERMAQQLTEVLGEQVHFRSRGSLSPEPSLRGMTFLAEIPADARLHRRGSLEAVAVPLPAGQDFLLVRPAFSPWQTVMQGHTYAVLLVFWLTALLLVWLVGRGLVRPLRHLASKLPEIEVVDSLHLPEANRKDEIGDLARAFQRTGQALRHERQQREQVEKLAVLGRMTAALAHEIQNPVSAIKMHAQLADADGLLPSARLIDAEADRIGSLVNQWLFLSKPEPPALAEVDLKQLVEVRLQTHLAQTRYAKVEVAIDLPPKLVVRADGRRLTQVIHNLISNAVQAMPEGGRLHLTGRLEDGAAVLTFADTGTGFSELALQRYNEFFFSEKEGGMGIGLTVVEEILKAHGGTLRVANRPEGGAIVTLSLPVSP